MAGSDIGSDTIKVREVSSWRASWPASSDAHFDVEREVLMFGPSSIG